MGSLKAALSRPLALELYPLIPDVNSALSVQTTHLLEVQEQERSSNMVVAALFVCFNRVGRALPRISLYDLHAQSWESQAPGR